MFLLHSLNKSECWGNRAGILQSTCSEATSDEQNSKTRRYVSSVAGPVIESLAPAVHSWEQRPASFAARFANNLGIPPYPVPWLVGPLACTNTCTRMGNPWC